MDPARLQRDVERWLTHESYRFSHRENDRNVFTVLIRHAGSFGHQIEVFQRYSRVSRWWRAAWCP